MEVHVVMVLRVLEGVREDLREVALMPLPILVEVEGHIGILVIMGVVLVLVFLYLGMRTILQLVFLVEQRQLIVLNRI